MICLKREILLSHDLICARSSPDGFGARQIIRITGANAILKIIDLFQFDQSIPGINSGYFTVNLHLDEYRTINVDFYFWKSPFSYTGQDVVELHLLSNSWILDFILSKIFANGFRLANPGEFTLRAFLNGKVDVAQVDAIHQVIEASTPDSLNNALSRLAGGIFDPLHEVKDELLNLLADIEANLDFAGEDIQIINSDQILKSLGGMLAKIIVLIKKLQSRGIGQEKIRVIFVGPPNVGKSSLFNVLVQGNKSLVSSIAGTTRDLVTSQVDWGEGLVELIDAPGLEDGRDFIEQQAQNLAFKEVGLADIVIYCAEKEHHKFPDFFVNADEITLLKVAMKCDISSGPADWMAISSKTLFGVDNLKKKILEFVHKKNGSGSLSGLSRINAHANLCLENLRRAHHCVLFEQPMEILALELREAVENLGQITGHVFTDDLLDRMFSRFCVGK